VVRKVQAPADPGPDQARQSDDAPEPDEVRDGQQQNRGQGHPHHGSSDGNLTGAVEGRAHGAGQRSGRDEGQMAKTQVAKDGQETEEERRIDQADKAPNQGPDQDQMGTRGQCGGRGDGWADHDATIIHGHPSARVWSGGNYAVWA